MKTVVPDYYKDFRCLAGDCHHSCCIGWEVDIDDDTLNFYRTVGGEFGRRLESSISYDEGTAHFCMDKEGRCPFLNEKGLCDIMTNLGFDKVSQICDDHPRFRNFYSGRTEVGLGLSCEAVAQMIVNKTDKAKFIVLEEGEELLWEDECDFLDLRDDIFDILQNREIPLRDRCAQMLSFCGTGYPDTDIYSTADFFGTLEKLDDERDILLDAIKATAAEKLVLPQEKWLDIAFEQLLVYFVFRHLTDSLDDGRLEERTVFCVMSAYIVYAMAAAQFNTKGEITPVMLADAARIYSAEIEYSTENTEKLLDYIETLLHK